MSEFNAALGLVQLKHIDQVLAKRKLISDSYKLQLANIKGYHVLKMTVRAKKTILISQL